jgi:hypothetical protein
MVVLVYFIASGLERERADFHRRSAALNRAIRKAFF